jgi:hypothetical protein
LFFSAFDLTESSGRPIFALVFRSDAEELPKPLFIAICSDLWLQHRMINRIVRTECPNNHSQFGKTLYQAYAICLVAFGTSPAHVYPKKKEEGLTSRECYQERFKVEISDIYPMVECLAVKHQYQKPQDLY